MNKHEQKQHWRGSYEATKEQCRKEGNLELGSLEWSDVPRFMRDKLCSLRACKLAASGERRICDERTCKQVHGI